MAAAFAWSAERARAGRGPTLVELVAMRMCGHAHHDDMLYLGKDPQPAWSYPALTEQGYADPDAYAFWAARDPITGYARRLAAEGTIAESDLALLQREAESLVEAEARRVIEAPWPDGSGVGVGVLAGEAPRRHVEVLEKRDEVRLADAALPPLEPGPPVDPRGRTFLDAVTLGVADALRADPRVFVYGEDVGGKYGNAFLLLRPLLKEFGDRILNSPLAEGGVLGVCIGAALMGQRPIGEMQFNDFVATGFNQLVNSAAKIRYRWGASVPMVVRMPWGGLRHAGPYHSQNTEPWFYRTPGLKIVTPSTPHDARALMAAAVADPDPVLYYEHIALYRDPRIKQALDEAAPAPLPIGRAALRRAGADLGIISYGAYVHVALRVAERLATDGIEAAVLDLRSLAPLDRAAVLAVARHCGQGARSARGLAHGRHRGEPGRDHPGRGLRVSRRAGARDGRARHARAVLAAAGRGVPAFRGPGREGGAAPGRVLSRALEADGPGQPEGRPHVRGPRLRLERDEVHRLPGLGAGQARDARSQRPRPPRSARTSRRRAPRPADDRRARQERCRRRDRARPR